MTFGRANALLKGVASVLIAALVISIVSAQRASAEEYLVWNSIADPQTCPVGDTAVWVEYAGGADCIRYFKSDNQNPDSTVVIRLEGDKAAYLDRALSDIPNNTAAGQVDYARTLSRRFNNMPVIVVSRPGTYGSSGDHRRRRSLPEYLALNSALDQIVAKYGINRMVLSGQSGGATAAAALMTLGRHDVSCALLTSGAYGLLERADFIRKRNGLPAQPGVDINGVVDPYDPLDHINGMVADPNRQIVLLGNVRDRVTPFFLLQRYADALERAGNAVEVLERPGVPPSFHHLSDAVGAADFDDCHLS